MTFDSRLFSGLVILACIGALLFLGAIDSMMLAAWTHGTASLAFDWLLPTESTIFVPFVMLMMLAVLLRELRSLVRK